MDGPESMVNKLSRPNCPTYRQARLINPLPQLNAPTSLQPGINFPWKWVNKYVTITIVPPK